MVRRDNQHQRASRILREAAESKRRFATTDYVLDETATLMKARGHAHLLDALFQAVFASHACRVEWTDEERFDSARSLFLQHINREWSFTDCLSFRVMRELRSRDALTRDGHFAEAGFAALLVD